MKRALIDADSLIYIIAWNHKESSEVDVKEACDTFLRDILLIIIIGFCMLLIKVLSAFRVVLRWHQAPSLVELNLHLMSAQ